MVDLASYAKDTLVSLKEIAKRQDISEKYLEQIVTQLNRSGLVRSVRGAQGGYCLAKSAADITVGDVLRVVEGPFDLVDCIGDGNCEKVVSCPTAYVWKKMKDALEGVVDNITLEELAQMAQNQAPYNYVI